MTTPREATTFHGDRHQFWTFDLKDGGRVSIPPDQVRRMWNAEQRAERKQQRGGEGGNGMMMWRVGRKVPINVYEGDAPVCQCHTPEMAARIVAAMNRANAGRAEQEETT